MKPWLCGFLLLVGIENVWCDLEFAKYFGGSISDFAVYADPEGSGKNYVYVARGGTILVLDGTQWDDLREIGRFYSVPVEIRNLAISGKCLTLAAGRSGVVLYSLEDPAHPQLASILSDYAGSKVQALDSLILVTNSEDNGGGPSTRSVNHRILDVNDPYHPIRLYGNVFLPFVGWESPSLYYPSIPSTPESLFWGVRNGTQFSTMYLFKASMGTDENGEIHVEQTPVGSTEWNTTFRTEISLIDMFVTGSYGFLSISGRFAAFDFSDMANPQELSSVPISGINVNAFPRGSIAYVPHNGACALVDISQPESLRILHDYSMPFTPKYVVNDIAYSLKSTVLCSSILSDTGATSEYSLSSGLFFPTWAEGDSDLVICGLMNDSANLGFFQADDSDELQFRSKITVKGYPYNVQRQESVVVANTNSGFAFVDIQDLSAPVVKSFLPVPWDDLYYASENSFNHRSILYRNYFYYDDFSEDGHALKIVSIEDLSQPVEITRLPMSRPFDLIRYGSTVYYRTFSYSELDSSIGAIDIREPEHPQFDDPFYNPGDKSVLSWKLNPEERRLYVLAGDMENIDLIIFDLSDPLHPTEIVSQRLLGSTFWIFHQFPQCDLWMDKNALVISTSGVTNYPTLPTNSAIFLFDRTNLDQIVQTQQIFFKPVSRSSNPYLRGGIVELHDHLLFSGNDGAFYLYTKPVNDDSSVETWGKYE